MTAGKQRLTFISYSRDNKDFAFELAKELKAAGFSIWFDQLDIPTGARWDDEIQKALEQCDIFMVILTPSSIASNNVKDEIGYAIDGNKRILPILLKHANVPFRLRRFQYVDFTNKSFKEGIEAAKQLLRRHLDDPTVTKSESVSTSYHSPSPQTVIDRPPEQKQERIPQVVHPTPAYEKKSPQRQTQRKPAPKLIPIIIGMSLLLLLCLGGGWIAWPYIFPPTPTITRTITPAVRTTETPAVTVTWTPSLAPASPTPNSPTIAPTNTSIPTITPFAPQEPDQFVIFYFENLMYTRDFDLGWSLLTQTFKEKNNPGGFEEWKSTWEKVVAWDRPSFTVSYPNSSTAIVTSPSITFYSESKYSLSDRKYCLVRDESRRTWMFEHKSICGL